MVDSPVVGRPVGRPIGGSRPVNSKAAGRLIGSKFCR